MQNIPLGKRIRDARKAVGITQEMLGNEIGVSRPAVVPELVVRFTSKTITDPQLQKTLLL